MQILDQNYEENVFVTSLPTLKYTNDWEQYAFGKTKGYPIYVSIQNNVNMNVPVVQHGKTSPFYNDNPYLGSLFGIHVYDKKFGFNNLTLIKPVFGYPYIGYDTEKIGTTYDSNGVLTGNVLNGITGLVETKLGDTVISTYTDPETDNIKNSLTKRKLYTEDSKVSGLTYGPYEEYEEYTTYYYVNVSARRTNGGLADYKADYVPASSCKFYKTNEISMPEIGNNASSYYEVSPHEVDGMSFTIGTMIETIGGSEQSMIVYLPVLPKTYDNNGAIHYKKNNSNEYVQVPLSSYQYIEITGNDYEISASDGYGEDVSTSFDLSTSIPKLQVISIDNGGILYIDKNEYNEHNYVGVFIDTSNNRILCYEQYWNTVDTQITTRDINNLVLIVSNQNRFPRMTQRVSVTETSYLYTHFNSIKVTRKEMSFKIDQSIYNLIEMSDVQCYNYTTNTMSDAGNKKSFYKTIVNNALTDYNDIEYIEKFNADNSVTVMCYAISSITNLTYYVGLNPINITSGDNKLYFRFNETNKTIQTLNFENNLKTELEIKDTGTTTEIFVKLKCGARVRGAQIIDNHITFDNSTVEINDVKYAYYFDDLVLTDNENKLEYPTTTNTSIFGLLGKLTNKLNKIATLKTSKNVVQYAIPESADFMFVVCVDNPNTDNLIKYISYSPKLCLQIPKIYRYDKNSIFITGATDWTASDMSTNIYLQYFSFTVEVVQAGFSYVGIIPANIELTFDTIETVEKLDNTEMELWKGVYGYRFTFTTSLDTSDDITLLYRITDTTGLSVVTSISQNTPNFNELGTDEPGTDETNPGGRPDDWESPNGNRD